LHEIEQLQHKLHAKLPAFKRKVECARAIIDEALALDVPFYIAFSGGIDSTCLLDLIWQVNPNSTVYWIDDGADYHETIQFVQDTAERYGFPQRCIRGVKAWKQWCIEMGRPDLIGEAMDAAWLNPIVAWHGYWHSDAQYAKWLQSEGIGLVFLGMLACESSKRRMILKGGYRPLYQVKTEYGIWHCSPLASWTKQDVWAYAISNNLPYNPVYDKLAELGLPLERRRAAPLTCYKVAQFGSVAFLRSGWPGLYNMLSATFPKGREYS